MSELAPVEYLYERAMVEDRDGYLVYEVRQHLITRKTAKRVFFDAGYGRTKSVDRQTLESVGEVWVRDRGGYLLHANLADAQPAQPESRADQVKRLRAEMAAVHPDRGGDAGEFRTAYARYQRAREQLAAA